MQTSACPFFIKQMVIKINRGVLCLRCGAERHLASRLLTVFSSCLVSSFLVLSIGWFSSLIGLIPSILVWRSSAWLPSLPTSLLLVGHFSLLSSRLLVFFSPLLCVSLFGQSSLLLVRLLFRLVFQWNVKWQYETRMEMVRNQTCHLMSSRQEH